MLARPTFSSIRRARRAAAQQTADGRRRALEARVRCLMRKPDDATYEEYRERHQAAQAEHLAPEAPGLASFPTFVMGRPEPRYNPKSDPNDAYLLASIRTAV